MRYLRLYTYFLRFSFSKAMEFRLNFFFRIIMDIIFYLTNILFFKVLYTHTQTLGGWNEAEALFFISCVFVVDAFNMTVFASNTWWLPIYINRGDLDYYLTKPVSPLFFLSLKEFAANSLFNLIIAIGFFFYTLNNLSIPLNIPNILSCILFIFIGSILYYLVNLIFVLPVFWTHSNRAFGDLFFTLAHFMERPDKIYFGATRAVLVTILPFILMASYPASYIIDGFSFEKMGITLISLFIIALIVKFIWTKGLKAYSSASS